MERLGLAVATVSVVAIAFVLSPNEARQQRITVPRPLPPDSYSRPPEMPFDRSDYVVKIGR